MDFITNNIALLAGGGSTAIALWVLKKVPNEKLYGLVNSLCFKAGTIITLGLAKWKFSRKIWNQTVEPYFIDLLENTVGAAVKGFIDGLKSD